MHSMITDHRSGSVFFFFRKMWQLQMALMLVMVDVVMIVKILTAGQMCGWNKKLNIHDIQCACATSS